MPKGIVGDKSRYRCQRGGDVVGNRPPPTHPTRL